MIDERIHSFLNCILLSVSRRTSRNNIMNFESEISLVKYPLSFVGLWPGNSPYDTTKLIIALGLNIIGAILNIIQFSVCKNTHHRIEKLVYISAFLEAVIFLCVMKKNGAHIKAMSNWIYQNWKNFEYSSKRSRWVMQQEKLKSRKFILLIYGLGIFVLICVTMDPFMKVLMNEIPLEAISDVGWNSFSIKTSPSFELVFVIRFLTFSLCCLILTSVSCYLILTTLHICGQMRILCGIIKNYEESTVHSGANIVDSNNCNCFDCIIDHHDSIAKLCMKLENHISPIIFARLSFIALQTSTIGYLLISDENFKFWVFMCPLLTYSSIWMIIGWLGEQLTQNGYKIGDAIYSLHWYEFRQLKIKRAISIIICRAQKPVKITAGKFFTVSCKVVGQFFITWISYISVLNAVISSRE